MLSDEGRQKIIGCAYKVHNQLGAGFVEKFYENALRIELEQNGFQVEQQVPIQVFYQGAVVGEFAADLLVQKCLLLELKAVQSLLPEHEVQLVNYLTATNIESGLLINFGRSVDIKRKFRDYRKAQTAADTSSK